MTLVLEFLDKKEQLIRFVDAYNEYLEYEDIGAPESLEDLLDEREVGIMYTCDDDERDIQLSYDLKSECYVGYVEGEFVFELPCSILGVIEDLNNDFQYFYGLFMDQLGDDYV